eukprot:29007-Pelagococcus_subviridis.AAC.5
MQFASDKSDLLMLAPSRSCCPRLFVSDARSAPARSTSASLPDRVRARRHRVRARLFRFPARVSLPQERENLSLVLNLDVRETAHRRSLLRVFPQLERAAVWHQEIVHELVVHLRVRALHGVVLIVRISRDVSKHVAQRQHHQPGVRLMRVVPYKER